MRHVSSSAIAITASRAAAACGWWRDYFVRADGEITWVHVDLSLAERVPVPGLGTLIRLTVPVGISAGRWEIAPADMHALERFAATVERVAAPPVGHRRGAEAAHEPLRLVGRRTRAGLAELCFYGEGPLDRRHLAEAARTLPGATVAYADAEDPGWRFYLESLHPGRALDPLLLTAVQLEERRRCGDDHGAPRAVDHLVRFRDARGRQRFAEALRAVRASWDLRPFEAGGERSFGLECTKEHTLHRWVIDPHVVALSAHAHALGGVYDGWGAPRVAAG